MGSEGSVPTTVALLQHYFPLVHDLKSYLSRILDSYRGSSHIFEPRDTDTPLYTSLVNTTFVAVNIDPAVLERLCFKSFPVMMDMREVMDKAQERIFRTRNIQNIITAGYRRAFRDGDRGRQDMSRVGITNHFVNTVVTALQSPEWDTLLERIGLDAMLHLLTETSLFLSLPNGCLCQVTGEPIIYTATNLKATLDVKERAVQPSAQKRAFPFAGQHCEQASKRHKSGSTAGNARLPVHNKTIRNRLAIIAFARSKIFYSRLQRLPGTGKIVAGLSRHHILNKIYPSYQRSPNDKLDDYVDPDPKEQERHARHLSKYIFPRQYGLRSVFTETKIKGSIGFSADYSNREAEIKGPCKTPKRLREALRLLDKMLWRHKKCSYKALRDKVCFSKVRNTDGRQLDSSLILEYVSEQSIILSQIPMAADTSYDSSGNRISPIGLTQAERHAKAKPRFADFACPYVEVYRFVAIVTKAVIPKAFWGNQKNLNVILKHVKTFIQCRRFESVTLHSVVQGFSTSECDWLMPSGDLAHQQARVSVSDALKRKEILQEFIFWYFDSFVISLLKTNFYITETSAFRNRVLYFLQDDWDVMCAPLIERLTAGTFIKMSDTEAAELLRQRKLGFSFVRLLPKETGVRPIVNLRRRTTVQRHGFPSEQSINQILQAAFHILTYEKHNHQERLGASVFSPDDIYMKLKAFKSRLSGGDLPHLYFVKMDVQACFDTIEQTKLLEILRELLSEERYLLQKYGQVRSAMGRIRRTFVKKAMPEDEHPHFLTYAAKLAGLLRQTIFVDQVVYSYSQRQDILSLLEEHITENIVKIGNHYYRQTVGIPQGSILSSILCSFFYGDLERRFTNFSHDPGSVMLRFIDDYLFITNNRTKAQQFVEMMNKGHPEYGCFVSKEKTLTNFYHGIEITSVTEPMQRSFPWCGYMIDMKDLSVSVDYSRYSGITLRDTLSIDRGQNPGAAFTRKMVRLALAKRHPIHSDTRLNTRYVIYLNIYQNFIVCAMKMHGYLSSLQSRKNPLFIYNTIQRMIHSCYSSLGHGNDTSERMTSQYRSSARKSVVLWLGAHAFYHILKKRSGQYQKVLRPLSFELSRPRSRRFRKQFSRLTQEGLAGLNEITF